MRLAKLEKRGLHARIVPVSRLADLQRGIDGPRQRGLLDEEFYTEELKKFEHLRPESFPEARSIIVIAVKMPVSRFIFNDKGVKVPVLIPPTYIQGVKSDRKAREMLSELLAPYKVMPALLPKKLLAVGSGLAQYGRNNITYVEGLGSAYWLSAFYSDMPCAEENGWREPVMMESCKGCNICMDSCPTGAISGDRFLLHAERCIVFHNERPGTMPFPAWMDPAWHNCLVGCMYCQEHCPENKGMLHIVDEAEFSREETDILIAGTPQDKLPAPLVKKLEDHDLLTSLGIIPRNLAALLKP